MNPLGLPLIFQSVTFTGSRHDPRKNSKRSSNADVSVAS